MVHVPPQSMSLSVPFKILSLQLTISQTWSVQVPLAQSVPTAQPSPSGHFGAVGSSAVFGGFLAILDPILAAGSCAERVDAADAGDAIAQARGTSCPRRKARSLGRRNRCRSLPGPGNGRRSLAIGICRRCKIAPGSRRSPCNSCRSHRLGSRFRRNRCRSRSGSSPCRRNSRAHTCRRCSRRSRNRCLPCT